jgi:hypothetical protein
MLCLKRRLVFRFEGRFFTNKTVFGAATTGRFPFTDLEVVGPAFEEAEATVEFLVGFNFFELLSPIIVFKFSPPIEVSFFVVGTVRAFCFDIIVVTFGTCLWFFEKLFLGFDFDLLSFFLGVRPDPITYSTGFNTVLMFNDFLTLGPDLSLEIVVVVVVIRDDDALLADETVNC